MSLPHDEFPLAPGIPPGILGDGAESEATKRSPLLTRWLVRATVAWLTVALAFWAWYLVAIAFVPQYLYPFLWLGLVGVPVWRWRRSLAHLLQRWQFPGFLTFMLLGYAMILLEEILAALVNNLAEGFTWPLFAQRVGQFWAFNLLAFTGFFAGWYLLLKMIGYSRVETFFLGGCFGLYAERTIFLLPGQPLQFALFAPLIIFIYGLILTPAALSIPEAKQRRPNWLLRYPLAFFVPFTCSVPPVALLSYLRAHFPGWFPPRTFIP
jgi:hypothetical protein